MKKEIYKIIFIILFIAGFSFFLIKLFPYALKNDLDKANFTSRIITLFFCAIPLIGLYRHHRPNLFSQNILAWIAIFSVTIILYSYKDEILNSKIIGNLLPMKPVEVGNNILVYKKHNDGHFHIETIMNNFKMICLVDTGASSILIDKYTAEKIGINLDELDFNILSTTANGVIYIAPSLINHLSIGKWKFENVKVKVSSLLESDCLLGMSFLRQFNKFYIEGDSLTLIK